MEQAENRVAIDPSIEKDVRFCKEKVEFLEKVLTMLVKGFASEY